MTKVTKRTTWGDEAFNRTQGYRIPNDKAIGMDASTLYEVMLLEAIDSKLRLQPPSVRSLFVIRIALKRRNDTPHFIESGGGRADA